MHTCMLIFPSSVLQSRNHGNLLMPLILIPKRVEHQTRSIKLIPSFKKLSSFIPDNQPNVKRNNFIVYH